MIFTNLYKSHKSPLSRLRHPHHSIVIPPIATASTDFNPDLVSKDKHKQKEAVQRHLQANVRNDWTFTWPSDSPEAAPAPQHAGATAEAASRDSQADIAVLSGDETALDSSEEADSESDAESVYSSVSDDPLHWKPRLEWASELSDDELCYNSPSPSKFYSPDSLAHAVTASKIARKARRRKELRREIAWNDGLACFEARRNAWTGAKVVRIRPKPSSSLSPVSPRRGMFWRTHSRSMSNAGRTSISSTSPLTLKNTLSRDSALSPTERAAENDTSNVVLLPETSRTVLQKQSEPMPVETLLPIPQPLLPPANPMRASINPTLYNSIYEKVVVNSLQPSCPINLSDMIRACVSGWKRDGEWPPRAAVPEPAPVGVARRTKSSISTVVSSSTPHTAAPGRKVSFSFRGGHGRTHGNESKPRRESAAGVDESPGPGNAIRRSLQRVLGIGQTMATAGEDHVAVQDHGVGKKRGDET